MKDTLKTIVICMLVEGGEHDGFGILECAYGKGCKEERGPWNSNCIWNDCRRRNSGNNTCN